MDGADGDRRVAPKPRHRVALVLGSVFVMVAALVVGITLVGNSSEDSVGAGSPGAQTPPAPGTVEVVGEPLVTFTDPTDDGSIGGPAPQVIGVDPAGKEVRGGGATGLSQILLVVGDGCDGCADAIDDLTTVFEGADPDGVELDSVGVTLLSSGSDAVEDDAWRVLLDDERGTAGRAFGAPDRPFWIFVDRNGTVQDRHLGSLEPDLVRTALFQMARVGA